MKMQVVTCPNCSGEVQVDMDREFGFCSFCGTKIIFSKDAPLDATQAFRTNREAALDEIQRLIDYFEAVEEFDLIEKTDKQIEIRKKTKYDGLAILGGIVILIGFAVMSSNAYAGFAIAALGILPIFFYTKNTKENKALIEELVAQRQNLSEELLERYDRCPHCPIGLEYCHPRMLYILHDYIRKGRAETIKEAVNLLATDEHNAEMMRIARNTQALTEANLKANTVTAVNSLFR